MQNKHEKNLVTLLTDAYIKLRKILNLSHLSVWWIKDLIILFENQLMAIRSI